ncbi:N-acetyltransferase [Streptomyces sp. AJS327]|uniref:GNAT family N-acetyltransferase n=1 Tax=Streptomyces sp. AJS327 TaxID=2545265 RepID=UPI0015DD9502|nr:GNAT family N-acetyltransferase [Streptomyces sp. AJS327]MBA0053769.1 N-acetyltransferase [Streptomyces sp. AJS327]
MAEGTEVQDNPGARRYEAYVDGGLAGFVAYTRSPGAVELTHTEVDPAYEGRGVGGALARTALDAAREAGDVVLPSCPFIAGWIQRHPDYQSLTRGA